MRYDAILLDADGTLYDFEAAERAAITNVLQLLHIDDPEAPGVYSRINAACWADFEKGVITQEQLRLRRFRELIERYGLRFDPVEAAETFVRVLSTQAQLLPGVEQEVRRIASLLPVAIVTNGIAEVQRSRFSLSPLCKYVKEIVISGEVGCAKPDPLMIFSALDKLGAKPERALMVGDSLSSDICCAYNAGVDACWFNPSGALMTLKRAPKYEIRSLSEIADTIL